MKFIPYDRRLKSKARELRNNSTIAEIILWKYLKGRKMCGFKFNRQKPIHHYIVDFYCSELKLAIEIDGEVHESEKDYVRQKKLESFGITFLRFTNDQITKDLHRSLEMIRNHVFPLRGEGTRCL